MATFHENLVQSFKNFKNKYIGSTSIADIGDGTLTSAVSEINQHLTALEKHTLGSPITIAENTDYVTTSDGYLVIYSPYMETVNNGFYSVFINNINVLNVRPDQANSMRVCTLYLKRGTIIKIYKNTITVTPDYSFYPLV